MLKQILVTSALVAAVAAHGEVYQVQSGSTTNAAPNIYYAADAKNSKTVTRKMYQASSPSFVLPTGYGNNNQMSCEGSANAPAPDTISVAAGSSLTVQWEGATGELDGFAGVTNRHPWVHAMGPIMDYITPCNGACSSFDATNAGWTKIAQSGIDFSQTISSDLRTRMTNKPEKYYPTSGSGLWAMAGLLQAGSQWTINIPSGLKAGEYLVRHELAAIHNPLGSDPTSGPQHYIACIQVQVTGSGTKTLPAGTQAKDLYSSTGTFAKFDVYSDDIHSFQVPGPAVWDGVSGGGSSSPPPAPASSSPAPASNSPAPKASTQAAAAAATTPAAAVANAASTPAASSSSSSSSSPAPKQCKRRLHSRKRATAGALKMHKARQVSSFH